MCCSIECSVIEGGGGGVRDGGVSGDVVRGEDREYSMIEES